MKGGRGFRPRLKRKLRKRGGEACLYNSSDIEEDKSANPTEFGKRKKGEDRQIFLLTLLYGREKGKKDLAQRPVKEGEEPMLSFSFLKRKEKEVPREEREGGGEKGKSCDNSTRNGRK